MSVGKICQREVDLADLDESVQAAAERMHQHTVGALLVLDEFKKPVGILTDRDIAVRVVAAGKDGYTTTVREAMTPQPKTVSEDAPIEWAVSLMRAGGFRRAPVVDQGGALVGLVSLDDILMLLAEEFADIGRLLEKETPRAAAELV